MGEVGGYTAAYSDFDFTRFESLYFGAAFSTAVGLAFDSQILESGETMTFTLADSDLPNGVGVWRGYARVRYFDIGNATWKWETLNTRFVLSATDLEGNPMSLVVLEALEDSPLISVTAPFSVNLRMEAEQGGWQPALFLFDNLHTWTHEPIQSGDDRVMSEFTGGFFYTDEAIAGLVAANDGPTVLGDPTTLTATIGAGTNVSYTWDLGDGGSDTGANVTYVYPTIGVFTAIVTATNSVSYAVANTAVVVEEAVAGLSASNDSPTALGDLTTLTATITAGTNVSYTWDLGDGESDTGATVTHVYPTIGVFTAIVTASNSVNDAVANTAVVVEEAVAGLSASNDSPTVQGGTTTLTATVTAGSNVTYAWAFGDGEFHIGRVVTHVYPVAGEFMAVVTASNSLNQLTASTVVSITEWLPPDFYIYIPLSLRAFP